MDLEMVVSYIQNIENQEELDIILNTVLLNFCKIGHTDSDESPSGFHCKNCSLGSRTCLAIHDYITNRSSIRNLINDK